MAPPLEAGPSANMRRRPRVSYRELDELSDEDVSELNFSSVRRQIHAPSRRSHRTATASRPTYHESSSEDESSEPSANNSDLEEERPSKRVRVSPQRKEPQENPFRRFRRPSHRPISHPQVAQEVQPPFSPVLENIPPWQTLPYQILRQIFEHASYPLYESATQPSQSIDWLRETSLLCRSFHEATISALLRSPPLLPLFRARELLRRLKKSQDILSIDYRNKIKRLDVEVKRALTKKRPIDLAGTIRLCPQLKGLRIYHEHDEMGVTLWSRPSTTSKSTKWEYDGTIFDAMDETGIYLDNFEWNGRFRSSEEVIKSMAKWHTRPSLRRLKSLSLLNLATSDKAIEQEDGTYEILLMEAIAMLPEVSHLSFQNCTSVNERLFLRMPHGLKSLTVIDCVSLTSSELSAFLREKGMHLLDLRLDSNQSLDLGFTESLAINCPRLRTFEMDLTYFDASSFHDVEPYFDQLLPTGPPSWPSTLQTIDLAQLRSWDLKAADEFLQSLADAAPHLPDLRFLSIKAILKSGWRDRAQLRQKWKTRLDKIFLRKWEEPERHTSVIRREIDLGKVGEQTTSPPHQTTKSKPRSPQHSPLFPNLSSSSDENSPEPTTLSQSQNQRKSRRIPVVTAQKEETLRKEAEQAAREAEQSYKRREAKLAAKRAAAERQKEEERSQRSTRTRRGGPAFQHEQHSPEETQDAADDFEVPYVQGLCTTVLFMIDDQRPSEAQFKEADFVDDEPSGDEDWNGKDIDFEDEWVRRKARGRKYAW